MAERLGREQSYIARVETGKADIQLSSFFRIAVILGIQFVPMFMGGGALVGKPKSAGGRSRRRFKVHDAKTCFITIFTT
ncbi:MAG: hypothetical protein NC356_02330 [Ruminococcus sp.]|nr:hypothetical protein [Ruminococcus sp.]